MPSPRSAPALLCASLLLASCGVATQEAGPRTVHPGAPGEEGRVVPDGQTVRAAQPGHAPADVRFMQAMIIHHAQALEMAALVPARTERADIRILARRIEAGQADEIALMQRWLERRGESAPDPLAHPGHGPAGGDHAGHMHGMLTEEEMARLAGARDGEFDRLFLERMIHHHEGALRMVEELFADPEAGQESEIYQFASHVESDQAIEIERMRRMLAEGR